MRVPCRGVLHTPHKHPARDGRIDLKSKNVHPFPLETIEGRMQYAPTQAHLYHPSIRYAYPGRGVLHTPHKHPARDECINKEYPNDYPFLLGMIEGRMQYVSTWKHPYHPSIQYVYPCRGLLNTPHKHPERDECTYQKSPNDSTTPEWPIEGRMQYAPT